MSLERRNCSIRKRLELEITPKPTDQEWERSDKLHGEVWKVITQEIIRRETKVCA